MINIFIFENQIKRYTFPRKYSSKYGNSIKYKHGMNGKQSFPRKGSFREQLETQIRISN